jgi:hypothetical protein
MVCVDQSAWHIPCYELIKERAMRVETVKKIVETIVQLILILTVGGTIGYVLLNIFYLREIYLDTFKDLLSNRL